MEQIQVNGAPATHSFAGNGSEAIAFGRPGREGGYIVETKEGMRRKFADVGSAMAWLGAVRSDPVPVALPEPASTDPDDAPPKKPKK